MLQKSSQGSKNLKKKIILKKRSPITTQSSSASLKLESPTVKSPLTPSENISESDSGKKPVPFDAIVAGVKQDAEKKKRGRPPKAASSSTAPSASANGAQATAPITTTPALASPEIPREVLSPLVQFPYLIAAKRTGFDGFALSKEEVDALVPMVDHCIRQYMPNVTGPHAVAVTLLGTVAMMTGTRYMMYLDWRKEQYVKHAENKAVQ